MKIPPDDALQGGRHLLLDVATGPGELSSPAFWLVSWASAAACCACRRSSTSSAAPTHVAVGTDLFEVMISGLYGAFTFSLKGRIEIVAVFVMLCGAAVGAQIGTVATKYSRGYGIRLMFGCAVVACMLSIIMKQYGFTALATVTILGAISVICVYIMTVMFRGAAAELREKRRTEMMGS